MEAAIGPRPMADAPVGQKTGITRRLARRGTRPSAPKDLRTVPAHIFGAICPARGVAAGLVMPPIWPKSRAMSPMARRRC